MKHLLSILAFVCFGAVALSAQDAVKGPKMQFDVTTVDYGTLEKGGDPIRKFKFTNVGNEPLIIKTAKGSCGCTVPTYPKEPSLPGESNVIEVRYDTQRVGASQKQVTLTTNETGEDKVLTIKGEVKDNAPKPDAAPANNGAVKQ